MNKATALAPANIAFVKYWGKKDTKLRLPLNSSISMNLSQIFTITTVEFLPNLREDQIEMAGAQLKKKERERIVRHLDRIRKIAGIRLKARVVTKNNFPKGTGIASSASGFAALTLAATKAAGLELSERELSILARLGSGSACRSIPDGFVEWVKGDSHKSSYAYSLYPPDYWNIADIVVVLTKGAKAVSSTEGHTRAQTSPFLRARLREIEKTLRGFKSALKKRDFSQFGTLLEREAINMHTIAMTSIPPIFYWLPETLEIMLAVHQWRKEGLECYWTIDAGPVVHLICQQKDVQEVGKRVMAMGNKPSNIIINYPARGARLVDCHLF